MPAVRAPFCTAHNINVVILFLNASVILKVVFFVAGMYQEKLDWIVVISKFSCIATDEKFEETNKHA